MGQDYRKRDTGDANADGIVNDKDASILGAHWQQMGGAGWLDGDFNGDGNVNDADAAILAAHWAKASAKRRCPSRAALPCWPGWL
jgi:hypothetical protein